MYVLSVSLNKCTPRPFPRSVLHRSTHYVNASTGSVVLLASERIREVSPGAAAVRLGSEGFHRCIYRVQFSDVTVQHWDFAIAVPVSVAPFLLPFLYLLLLRPCWTGT